MTTRPKKSPSARTRGKPVTIDMEAEKVTEPVGDNSVDMPGAEPVAMTEPGPSENAQPAGPDTKVDADLDKEASASEVPIAGEPSDENPAPKGRSVSGLLGGIVGGALALLGAAGLQTAGVLPNLGASSVDTSGLEAELAALDARVSAAEAPPPATGNVDELAGRIDDLGQTSDANADVLAVVTGRLDEASASIARLNSAVEGGEAGDGAALEALSARIAEIETVIDALRTQEADLAVDRAADVDLSKVTGRLDEMSAQLESSMADAGQMSGALAVLETEMTQSITSLSNGLETLAGDVATLKDQVAAGGADSTAVARAFAASSLKNAVDRGGAFGAELEAFATVAQEDDGEAVATLRGFASGGVPTLSQLVDAYPATANAIITSARTLDENAGFGQRLLNNMQGLVSVRPVDEQEGIGPTAISTRIGARLSEGDLRAALDEWETLSDPAKAASQEFADQVRARATVDGLISNILTAAMSGTSATVQ